MTTDEAIKIITEYEDKIDYSHTHPIIRGLLLLKQHEDNVDKSISFEHDQMWAAVFATRSRSVNY